MSRLGLASLMVLLVFTFACEGNVRRKSDEELGLNPQQARGRRIYDAQCARCHDPYSSRSVHGPSLAGVYKKPYLPSGMPANDDRIGDVVMHGKAKMPAFNQTINERQLEDLLAYMKTL